MTLQERIDALLSKLKSDTEATLRLVDWMRANQSAIEDIGITPTPYGSLIDFDGPDRDQVLKIIKAFPGKWNKGLSAGGGMNYVREKIEGEPNLRIWSGALPPSCKMVEEVVLVPEHYETKQRIVCHGAKAEPEAELEAKQPVVMEA